MRTLSATLLAAQKAVSNTPYIRIYLPDYSGGTDLSSYCIALDHIEQTFGGSATLLFTDATTWFCPGSAPIDLRGQRVDIGYGCHTGVGDEYSTCAPLYVRNTRLVSAEGILQVQFDCFDFWQKLQSLRVTKDAAGPAPGWTGDKTIQEIFEELLEAPFSGTGMSLTIDSTDGIFDTFKPYYLSNINDPLSNILSDLINLTNCGVRMRNDGLHVLALPTDTSGAVNFGLGATDHRFFSAVYDDEVSIPNRVIVVNDYDTPVYFGYATDTNSYGQLGYYVTRIYAVGGINSNTEATQMAEAILSAIMRQTSDGVVIVPHHCGLELYDYVTVTDTRW